MADWIWLIVALAVGLPLLLTVTLVDLRRRRKTEGPRVAVSDENTPVPGYLTQEDIDSYPDPAGASDLWPRQGRHFAFGFAHPDFRTHGPVAQWQNATVLVVEDPLHDMRQVTGPLSSADQDHPLVIVAPSIEPDLLATLAANRRALHAPILACEANQEAISDLSHWCGAAPLRGSDLAAGYVPPAALGKARRWISEPRGSWIEPAFAHSD